MTGWHTYLKISRVLLTLCSLLQVVFYYKYPFFDFKKFSIKRSLQSQKKSWQINVPFSIKSILLFQKVKILIM